MAYALCSRQDCSFGAGAIPSDTESDRCSIYTNLAPTLKKHFGYGALKPGQAEAILAVLHGHDVFVQMATGSGKSLCMFLPPLLCDKSACAVIISSLVGLMSSQVCSNLWYNLCNLSVTVLSNNTSCMIQGF